MKSTSALILTTAHRSRGLGHAMRMLALGEELLARGIAVSMPALADDPRISTLAMARGDFAVRQMAHPDIVIVDDYEADPEIERRWIATGALVVAVDDAPTRKHDCQLLIDQNDLFERHADAYRSQASADARLLLGPRFAMLGRSIRRARSLRSRRDEVRRVVVNWGAIDRPELTALAEGVLARRGLEVRVITSRDGVADMAEHWQWADLAVGAAGSSSWERACMGLPSIVIAVADNQVPVGQTLDEAGLAVYAGTASELTQDSLEAGIDDLRKPDRVATMAARCTSVVDGHGAARVARAIHARAACLSVRDVRSGDSSMLRAWRNDPESVRQSLQRSEVTESEHDDWIRPYLAIGSPSLLLIVQRGARSVGFVRFDDAADGWRLSYGVAPECRGDGLAAPMVDAGLDELTRRGFTGRITADVRDDNERSLRTLHRCGFLTEAHRDGIETLRTVA